MTYLISENWPGSGLWAKAALLAVEPTTAINTSAIPAGQLKQHGRSCANLFTVPLMIVRSFEAVPNDSQLKGCLSSTPIRVDLLFRCAKFE